MTHTITSACTGCAACKTVCPVNAIRGEKRALHVISAAVCIDCGACGRICPFKAVHDASSKLCDAEKRALWLKPVIQVKACVSCGLCLQVCPTGVLDYAELVNHRVRSVAHLRDPKNCIGCSFCASVCPVEAIQMRTPRAKHLT